MRLRRSPRQISAHDYGVLLFKDCDKRKKRTVEDEKEIEADKKLIVGPIRLVSSNSCDKV